MLRSIRVGLRQRLKAGLQHAVEVLTRLFVPEPKRPETGAGERRFAALIVFELHFHPRLRSGLWRKSSRFRPKMTPAILAEYRADPASLSLRRPNSFASCSASHGPVRAVRLS
jgi:hypothetical protein